MGEALPYTGIQIAKLVDGAVFKGVKHYDHRNVIFLLERDGQEIEMEVDAEADWSGANDWTMAETIRAELTVYLRGVDDDDRH